MSLELSMINRFCSHYFEQETNWCTQCYN